MPVYSDQRSLTVGQAKSISKVLNSELIRTNPGGIIDFFEIDLEDILFDSMLLSNKVFNTGQSDSERVFRFHNCLNFTTKNIIYQGKNYIAAPIFMQEVEYTTKGILPRPKISIVSNAKGIENFSLFKSALLSLGDITGAKLVRRRTFIKFIDKENTNLSAIIANHDPNPNAILRFDLFYFFRKTSENETSLEFELASKMDTENVTLPKRIVLQDKCVWQYRGEGCCYDRDLKKHVHGFERSAAPLSARFPHAEPVANVDNVPFRSTAQNSFFPPILPAGADFANRGEWKKEIAGGPLKVGNYVFIQKNDIKYYFVCILDNPENLPPPNPKFWVADQCSKSILGCSLRFDPLKGLPFGGFAATRKASESQ